MKIILYSLAEKKKFFVCCSPSQLSSELQVDINTEDLYLKFDKTSFKPATTSRNFDNVAGNNKEVNNSRDSDLRN